MSYQGLDVPIFNSKKVGTSGLKDWFTKFSKSRTYPKNEQWKHCPGGVEALAGGGRHGLQWCAKTHRLKPLLQHGRFPLATLERENNFGDRFHGWS